MNAKQPANQLEDRLATNKQRFDRPNRPTVTFERVGLRIDRAGQPMVTLIAILLSIGALFIASSLIVPIVIAVLGYLSLRPIIARLCSFGLPQSVASAGLILASFAIVAVIASVLYSPAQEWIATAPQSVAKIKDNFASIVEPLTVLDRMEEKLDTASDSAGDRATVEVSIKKPRVVDQTVLINTTGQVVAFIAAISVLTFFMLSTGDELLNRVLLVLPDQASRHELMEKIGEIQRSVGKYLGQITLINVGLGIAVSIVMWAVGMPSPVLWGVLATLFNYIPYVGPLAATVLVFVAASGSFDTLFRAALTAAAFWSITAVEGQFVTPSILGKSLKVGPVVVLVAVAFWGFLWGLPGVFLAVPLLIVLRQIFASFQYTYPLAVILGEDPCRPGEDCKPIKEDQPIAETA